MALQFDDRDAELLAKREAIRATLPGPLVGDFVAMPDGAMMRFTHDWGDTIQTTSRASPEDVSFFFFKDGEMSFSGSLYPAVPKAGLTDTGTTLPGSAWFFHHDETGAHRGVHFKTPCRVWKLT
ncbi:MAG TPA: hypothetical protein VM867_08470 [Xanthobacteraceae bacterium]|nr:hypothetical protein [Xanthobacteraceae bacterium]